MSLSNRAAATSAASKQQASVSTPASNSKPRNQLALLSLSGALLAAGPAGAVAPGPADVAPAPISQQQVQHISSTAALKFPSVSAPKVYASDAGLTTRTASGPAINYDDPDAYWDQLEGQDSASRTTPPATEYLPIKYVEATAGPSVVADLADLNADVRGLAENYRDPAGAIQQDKAADALSSSSTPDLSSAAESAKDAASDLKSKAKSALKGNSALPNSMATVADLNADVRGDALNYRDPAIATPQDKVTGSSGSSGPSAAAESMSGDQGADVRGDALNYRDPAGAVQQDNFVDAVKDKISALPNSVATVADLNADVRGLAENYRDPAGAIQQDKAADALSSSSTPDLSSAAESAKDAASDLKSKAKSALKGNSALPNSMGTVAADVPGFRKFKDSFRPESEKDPNAGAFGDYSARNPENMQKAKEARKDLKTLSKSVLSVKGGNSALPTNPLGVVADLNADVRGEAADYRDPAIATPQDKAAGALSSSSTPDLSSATEGAKDAAESAKDAASDLKSKAKSALKGSSALPNSMATVADLNADVRGDALNYRDPAIATPQDKVTGSSGSSGPSAAAESMSGDQGADVRGDALNYRDPAGAVQQDNFVDAVKDKISALPNSVATVADLNADVRGLAENYRDPAGAIQQDKAADALSSSSTPDLSSATEGAKDAASDLKSKAKSALKGNSALPNSMATVADLNADVRGDALNYRDPAIATPQDKVTGSSGSSGPSAAAESMSGDQGADVRGDALNYRDPAGAVQQDNFVDAVKDKISALPNSVATVADLNADVRGLAENYRDPAGAIQQDKAADALSFSSTPDLSSAAESAKDTASDLKSKAKSALKGNSALPNSVGTVADLNKDVRGEAGDYRDPAAAIQQDTAAGAADKVVSSATSATKALPTKGLSTPSVPKPVKKAFTPPSRPKKDIGVGAGYGPSGATVNDSAGVKRVADEVRGSAAPPAGNARLSRPLVRDSLGQLRPMAVNQTGAAGSGQQRGVKMAKKAADKVGGIVDNVSAN